MTDIDYDYTTDHFLTIYCNSDNEQSDSDTDNEQTNCFTSSVCYTEMRANLKFERFCQSCQNAFLTYFTRQLHIISNSCFLARKKIRECQDLIS